MAAFRPTKEWGPGESGLQDEWIEFKKEKASQKTRNPFRQKVNKELQQKGFDHGLDNIARDNQSEYYCSDNNGTRANQMH